MPGSGQTGADAGLRSDSEASARAYDAAPAGVVGTDASRAAPDVASIGAAASTGGSLSTTGGQTPLPWSVLREVTEHMRETLTNVPGLGMSPTAHTTAHSLGSMVARLAALAVGGDEARRVAVVFQASRAAFVQSTAERIMDGVVGEPWNPLGHNAPSGTALRLADTLARSQVLQPEQGRVQRVEASGRGRQNKVQVSDSTVLWCVTALICSNAAQQYAAAHPNPGGATGTRAAAMLVCRHARSHAIVFQQCVLLMRRRRPRRGVFLFQHLGQHSLMTLSKQHWGEG
jgi:hypothetical protein